MEPNIVQCRAAATLPLQRTYRFDLFQLRKFADGTGLVGTFTKVDELRSLSAEYSR
jgi:hypothetical protein